jgi:hypothetical protein
MAANPKPIRKESKLMGESVRKSHLISLKNAPKKMIKERSKSVQKMSNKIDKKHKK